MTSTSVESDSPRAVPRIVFFSGSKLERHAIESVLQHATFSLDPHHASHPGELAALLATPPDAVVIATAGATLASLIEDIRTRAPSASLLLFSHETDAERITACFHAGVSDFLPLKRADQLPSRLLQLLQNQPGRSVTADGPHPRVKAMVDACPEPGWISDRAGAFIYFNQAWFDFTGDDPASAFGETWLGRLPPEDRIRFTGELREAVELRQCFHLDLRLRRHDDAYRWVHLAASVHTTATGEYAGHTATCTDISVQQETQSRLAYRAITQTALAGFGRFALGHHTFNELIQEATRLVCDTLQLHQSEVLAIEDGTLRSVAATGFDADYVSLPMRAPNEAELDGQPLILDDDHAIFPGRENHPALGTRSGIAAPISGGRFTTYAFLTGLSADPREYGREALDFIQALANLVSTGLQRERAQAALEESEKKLLQSQKMEAVGLLAGGVAHDFNNLLTAVRCYGEMLNEDLATIAPDLQSKVTEILKASARASSLTRQLLTFSRKQVLQPETLDMNMVVTDLRDLIRSILSENVTLQIDLIPGNAYFEADRNQIDQIVLNLCLNARDAMPQGGLLSVRVDRRQITGPNPQNLPPRHYLVLEISDTGVGMTPEVQQNIFQPFFTTKPVGRGTGLGLATCAVIVRNFNGAITFTSEPGRGTCFSILIPQVEPPTFTTDYDDESPPNDGGRERIAIVEDDEAVRHVASLILIDLGYDVTAFPGSVEALQHFEANPDDIARFDLLLSDMVMPGMNGRDLAIRLTAMHPKLKVLFMSGYVGDPDTLKAVQDADLPFLEKPFTRVALARKVRETLG